MPGKDKKWGDKEERDLAVAIILSQQGGNNPKYNWPTVHELMNNWGYEFSRDAMAQHWTKRIMKDFKERHGSNATTTTASQNTPKSAAKKAPSSASASKGRKKVKDEPDSGNDSPLAKKRKRTPEGDSVTVKTEDDEPRRRRERSMTMKDDEAAFTAWVT